MHQHAEQHESVHMIAFDGCSAKNIRVSVPSQQQPAQQPSQQQTSWQPPDIAIASERYSCVEGSTEIILHCNCIKGLCCVQDTSELELPGLGGIAQTWKLNLRFQEMLQFNTHIGCHNSSTSFELL
jgi:hypothetical protein